MTDTSLLSELYCAALPSVRDRPLRMMPARLYAYVYKVSSRQQVPLCLLTAIVFPLTLAPLEFQRRIVDNAIAGAELSLLLSLGALYFATVLLHGGLKFGRNLYQDRVAEGVTRLLRLRIAESEAYGAEPDEGTKQSIISSEAENVGGFVSESFAFPLLQTGIVLSVAGYMLILEPLIAAVALAFFLPSIGVVVGFQPTLNGLSERKTTVLRELGESVLNDHRGADSADAEHSSRIERVYALRVRFSTLKHAMKFLNNLFGHLGPLSVLMVGGWLAIRGETQVGTIVAFLSGYERMMTPARELLNFYRRLSIMRVQYALVRKAAQNDDVDGT